MPEPNRENQEQPEPAPDTARKPYSKPVLTVHGKIDELTRSGPGRRAEAGSGHSHP